MLDVLGGFFVTVKLQTSRRFVCSSILIVMFEGGSCTHRVHVDRPVEHLRPHPAQEHGGARLAGEGHDLRGTRRQHVRPHRQLLAGG